MRSHITIPYLEAGDGGRGANRRQPESALTPKAAAIRGTIAEVWPPAMIGLGLLLTLAWSGSLLWLFVRMVLAVV